MQVWTRVGAIVWVIAAIALGGCGDSGSATGDDTSSSTGDTPTDEDAVSDDQPDADSDPTPDATGGGDDL